jgi:hypothetical protein
MLPTPPISARCLRLNEPLDLPNFSARLAQRRLQSILDSSCDSRIVAYNFPSARDTRAPRRGPRSRADARVLRRSRLVAGGFAK